MAAPVEASDRSEVVEARRLLDDALIELRAIEDGALPVRAAEEGVAEALRGVYEALASSGDYQRFWAEIGNAIQLLQRTIALVPQTDDPAARRAISMTAQAMGMLRSCRFDPLRPPLDLPGPAERVVQASTVLPRLLAFPRRALRPRVPLPELDEPAPPAPEPPPEAKPITTMAELDALLSATESALAAFDAQGDEPREKPPKPPPERPPVTDDDARREHFGLRQDERTVLFERARGSMEDLSMLGLLRRQAEGQEWFNGERSERRLVRKVDAIVACGEGVFPRLVEMLEERPGPDPELTFGVAFFFGCVAGDDALDELLRIVRIADLEIPEMREAVTDALSYAPHEGIAPRMREWLRGDWAARRAIAVTALHRRGLLDATEAARAARDADVEVVAAAAHALGTAPGDVHPSVLAALLRHDDERVVRAALESAMLRRLAVGLDRAIELTIAGQGDFADAVLVLGACAGSDALPILREAAATNPGATLFRAIGWFGHVELVDYLIGRLEPEKVKSPVVEALHRITGAGLSDVVPDPEYQKGEEPFRRKWQDPDSGIVLSEKAEVWAAWWQKHKHAAAAQTRWRFGYPWSARASLWELEDRWSVPAARRLARMELCVRTGVEAAFELDDWVARQLHHLAALRQRAGSSDASKGTWHHRIRG